MQTISVPTEKGNTMREKLIELLESAPGHANNEVYSFAEIVDNLIANGVRIPVRCKDCKYWCKFDGFGNCCSINGLDAAREEDFCSYGVRKENPVPNITGQTMDAINKMGNKVHGG